jgi:hypothetical protein
MGLHFLPLLVGAAAGAAITYVFKDDPSREKLKAGAEKAGEGVKRGLGKARSALARKPREPIAEISSS